MIENKERSKCLIFSLCCQWLQENIEIWGHEYLRNLAGEIGEEYQARRDKDQTTEDLLNLVAQIVPYHMQHNSGTLLPSIAC